MLRRWLGPALSRPARLRAQSLKFPWLGDCIRTSTCSESSSVPLTVVPSSEGGDAAVPSTTATTAKGAVPPPFLVPPREVPPPRLSPARQNPFSPVLTREDAKVLLAKASYAIFTLAYSAEEKKYAIYAATTNEVVVADEASLWRVSMWMDERITDDFIAGLLFGSDTSALVKTAVETITHKTMKRTVVAPDTWGITYLAFRAQQEAVQGADLPQSLEHASFLLSQKQFDAGRVDPTMWEVTNNSKSQLTDKALLQRVGAIRSALLSWDVLLDVHRRFGTPGSRKTLNPIDQIVRRVVKAVNVFIVDLDVRVGKGTIADGHTMIATIYDAQRRTQSVHYIRSLAEETAKLNALTTLLYGEGSSSISLFVPTRRTRASQLVAFARTCRPKSPFFVTELTSLGPYLGAVQLPLANGSVQEDPRGTWAMIRNSYATDKQVKRDEEKLNQLLLRGFTALANKLFSDRLQKVAPAIISAVNSIPSQELDLASYTRVEGLVEEARRNPVPHLTASTFLNKVNVNDAEVVFGLQQWRSKIYENADRRQREQQAMEGLRRYLVIDLETTTARRYKRIANPFTKENFVVLSGARDHKGRVFMPKRYFDRSVAIRYDDPNLCAATYLVEKSSKLSLFLPPLDDYDVLVGHNIKFDLLHLWRDAELRRFLARGGKVWDTMYAEYLLTGQDVKLGSGAGLEDVAKSYGGQTPKLDAVKRAWAEGKDTYEIPYATLTEYLHGDLENTELIFRKHMERAFNQRQVIICNARMDSLLCTTEMEYNGLKTNVDLALTQSSKLVKQVADLRARLISCIPTELPADCHKFFNWSSNQHLIAFFFGGKLKLSTHARSSKILPGETFSRHTLYLPTSAYPPTAFPNGVFLRPPVHVMGVCDCAILAGTSMAKGTRIFKAYFEAYMRQGNFRKSSTLLESLRQEMVAIPRSTPERRGESSALANLLPRRHLFLFAALSSTATGGIAKLFVKNAITGESITITEDQKGAKLRGFIAGQVRAHTAMLLPVDGDVSEENAAFAEAQVTILVRDAAFSWLRSWNTDESLVAYLQEHTGAGVGGGGSDGARPTQGVDPVDRYSISFADTVATLAYFKHQYSDAGAKRTSAEAVIPAKVLPPAKRSKGATAEVWCKMLRQEANMKPEEWCNYYIDLCLHMANAALQKEGEQSGETPRASTSKKPTKLKKKQAAAAPDDDDLPIMLRQRRAFVGFYNSLPENDRKRLSLMNMVGKTVGSVYDCYAQACSHDDVVEVDLKGKLATYIQNELEADQVMRRFRSSSTRQLQVGEDTLKYFKKTHKDDTAAVILELRGMEKLIGTYYESTDGGTGMVSLVHSVDSCIHHELIHNKTNTGRLASANPNCQNIPKEDKSQLRDMFISRFSEQGMCIESDYSQLEVVALAVLSSDDQMLEDLRQNVDFHCKRVTMMRPDLKYTDVLFRAKKNKEPEFVKLRQQAKIFSFQRQYGAGAKMISQSTGLTQDQVRMLIEKERETYRGVDVFNNIVTLSANNYDASLQDGSRNVRGHQFFKGMFPVLTGSRYIFTESDVPEGMINHRDAARKSTNFSPTHLKNYPVQGFAGEVVQIILGRLWRHFQAKNNYNELAFLTNTVHDCVWVDCHVSVYREVAKDVESIMNSARAVLNELFPEMNVTVEFPCDIVAGDSMGTLRPIVEEASY